MKKIYLQNFHNWVALGIAEAHTNCYMDALEKFMNASKIENTYPEIWYDIGVLYECHNQTAEAIEAYKRALSIDQEFTLASSRKEALSGNKNGDCPDFVFLIFRVADSMVPNKALLNNPNIRRSFESAEDEISTNPISLIFQHLGLPSFSVVTSLASHPEEKKETKEPEKANQLISSLPPISHFEKDEDKKVEEKVEHKKSADEIKAKPTENPPVQVQSQAEQKNKDISPVMEKVHDSPENTKKEPQEKTSKQLQEEKPDQDSLPSNQKQNEAESKEEQKKTIIREEEKAEKQEETKKPLQDVPRIPIPENRTTPMKIPPMKAFSDFSAATVRPNLNEIPKIPISSSLPSFAQRPSFHDSGLSMGSGMNNPMSSFPSSHFDSAMSSMMNPMMFHQMSLNNPSLLGANPSMLGNNPPMMAGNTSMMGGVSNMMSGNPSMMGFNPSMMMSGNPYISMMNPSMASGPRMNFPGGFSSMPRPGMGEGGALASSFPSTSRLLGASGFPSRSEPFSTGRSLDTHFKPASTSENLPSSLTPTKPLLPHSIPARNVSPILKNEGIDSLMKAAIEIDKKDSSQSGGRDNIQSLPLSSLQPEKRSIDQDLLRAKRGAPEDLRSRQSFDRGEQEKRPKHD